jgi:hypothetical protein
LQPRDGPKPWTAWNSWEIWDAQVQISEKTGGFWRFAAFTAPRWYWGNACIIIIMYQQSSIVLHIPSNGRLIQVCSEAINIW